MKKRRYFIYGLNIIQLVVFFVLLITLIGSLASYKEIYSNYINLFPEDRVLNFASSIADVNPDKEKELFESMEPVLDRLIEEGEILYIFDMQYREDFFKEIEGIYSTSINESFLERYPIKIESGRSFTKEEIENTVSGDVIPIIIGSNLKDKFKIGDELTEKIISNDTKVVGDKIVTEIEAYKYKKIKDIYKYKVVGIAEANTMVYLDTVNELSSKYTDNMIYMANYKEKVEIYMDNIFDKKTSDEYGVRQWIGFIESPTKEASARVLKILNSELKARNNMGYVYYPSKDNMVFKQLREAYMSSLILCVIFSIFSIVGVIGSIIYSIKDRRKEYGILSALGATKRYIIMKNTLTVIALMIISIIIALGITVILRNDITSRQVIEITNGATDVFANSEKYLYVINENLLKCLGLAFVVVATISSIPILYKIRKYVIVDLIRGR